MHVRLLPCPEMKKIAANHPNPWVRAWPDALAVAGCLALAWFSHWETKDLVWSLWLSSLVVGYAMIVWSIFGPAVFNGAQAWGRSRDAKLGPLAKIVESDCKLLDDFMTKYSFFEHDQPPETSSTYRNRTKLRLISRNSNLV